MAFFGNQIWQSNEFYGVDGTSRCGFGRQLGGAGADGLDRMDNPDGPPEPVAQVRVLPGALSGLGWSEGSFEVATQVATAICSKL